MGLEIVKNYLGLVRVRTKRSKFNRKSSGNMKSTLIALSVLAALSQVSAATFITDSAATGSAIGNHATVFAVGGADISIAALGAFNSGSTGSLTDTLTVTLWQFGAATPQAGGSVSISGTGDGAIGAFVYKNLDAPIVLPSGSFWSISVSGFTAGTPYSATQPTFDVAIGATFGAQYTIGINPGNGPYTGTPFTAGSYSTTAVSGGVVPEPETYAMLAGLGLVGFGLYRRCRK